MRTSSVVTALCLGGLAVGLTPAVSFDGQRMQGMSPVTAPLPQGQGRTVGRVTPLGTVPIPPANIPNGPGLRSPPPAARPAPQNSQVKAFDALRSGAQMLRDGQIDQGVTALEYAAERGLPSAMWKLGRIYADGDGVGRDQKRAFDYFRSLTRAHAYEPPNSPHARFVANAFVSLGHFHLHGIPNSDVKADAVVAHQMFRHAASYFGDPEAQYQVGRMYLNGSGTEKDAVQASRWLRLAADAGQRNAQALLGSILFRGTSPLPRQAAMGLFWLTVAKDATKEIRGPEDRWIVDSYASAFAQATEDERAMALGYLERWMGPRR
jgi:TPR repeat protein